jgi:hypothetical protein
MYNSVYQGSVIQEAGGCLEWHPESKDVPGTSDGWGVTLYLTEGCFHSWFQLVKNGKGQYYRTTIWVPYRRDGSDYPGFLRF